MQEVQSTLPIGTILRNRYVVEDLLGKGGFGAVYLVRDQRVKGNLFALKEIVDSSKQERARFAFECEVLKRTDHPALPRVYRVFEDDKNNRAYMLMDYIEGSNLETSRLQQPEKRFPLDQVMNIMAPIIDAVSYLHSQKPPIIHRDIKPANIIVPTTGDQAVLVDLGIAKEYDPESTTTAVRRCSPGYGAPEQYSKGTNTRTDIYGLAATFYTLLTGFVPDDAFYRMTQLGSRGVDPLESVSQLVPSIPVPVSDAIQRAMSISSNDRFSTVEQFWQALHAYPTEQEAPPPVVLPVTPIPPSFTPQALADVATVSLHKQPQETSTKKRGLLLPILLVLVALALGLGVVAAYWSFTSAGHQPSHTPTSTPVITHPKLTPTSKATLAPTSTPVRSNPTPVPATPTPVPATYPSVAGTHSGSVHNTNNGATANMTLSLTQSGGTIGGNVSISSPLSGSGPISSGYVKTNRYIQFVVQSNGIAPILFTGSVQSNGSMSGSYCSIDTTGNCNANVGGQGTWNAGPGPSSSGSSFIFPASSNLQQSLSKRQDPDINAIV